MIYILSGNDFKAKSSYILKLASKTQVTFLPLKDASKEYLINGASTGSLFGDKSFIVVEDFFIESEVTLTNEDLEILKNSSSAFVFLEDKMLAKEQKKYAKYAEIKDFKAKEIKEIPKVNVFSVADAYARKDKVGAWVAYNSAIESGIAPEAISGILFWKIKTMILNNNKEFKVSDLKRYSSEIVALYHKAHGGEVDFVIALEQFILSSLSSGK
jgi:DNA polymerase III delta subunit